MLPFSASLTPRALHVHGVLAQLCDDVFSFDLAKLVFSWSRMRVLQLVHQYEVDTGESFRLTQSLPTHADGIPTPGHEY